MKTRNNRYRQKGPAMHLERLRVGTAPGLPKTWCGRFGVPTTVERAKVSCMACWRAAPYEVRHGT
jgi:hypothetical protein